MSAPDCGFAYSQARLQARLGSRTGAADWQRMNATRDLGALLQAAATTALAPWTRELSAHTSVHEAERKLRRAWLDSVDEIASWQPRPWQAAITWLRWLPYLPALEKLARGGKSPEWMRGDPLLGPIVAEDPRQRAASLQRSECAPLASGFQSPPDVTAAWIHHWRSLWPERDPGGRSLERSVLHVRVARAEIAGSPPGTTTATVLARLEKRLMNAFRRHPLSPVATVAWLGLVALDLMQLRGQAVTWALRVAREDAA
jgi:hypothetical protein